MVKGAATVKGVFFGKILGYSSSIAKTRLICDEIGPFSSLQ